MCVEIDSLPAVFLLENQGILIVQFVVVEQLLWLQVVLWRYPFDEVVRHWKPLLSWVAWMGPLSLRSRINWHALIRLYHWLLDPFAGTCLILLIVGAIFLLFKFVLIQSLCNIDDNWSNVLSNIFFILLVEVTHVHHLSSLKQVLIDVLEYFQYLRLLNLLQLICWQILHRFLL